VVVHWRNGLFAPRSDKGFLEAAKLARCDFKIQCLDDIGHAQTRILELFGNVPDRSTGDVAILCMGHDGLFDILWYPWGLLNYLVLAFRFGAVPKEPQLATVEAQIGGTIDDFADL
jgi:hypothetical protein